MLSEFTFALLWADSLDFEGVCLLSVYNG